MEIKIIGNKESYQLHRRVEYLEVKLSRSLSIDSHSPINIYYGDVTFTFDNTQKFQSFIERIKGATLERVVLLSHEFSLPSEAIEKLSSAGDIEIGLFKSIFMVYNWIEIALTDAYAVSLSDKIFNNFILDYTGNIGVQKDIYFINSKFTSSVYYPHIERLVELNLLAKAVFDTNVGDFDAYFIPLIKPGVSREFFKSDKDLTGKKTYEVWKQILDERDSKLRYWQTYRY